MANSLTETILQKVRDQYEEYPYPDYPLLARPRWQEGVLGGTAFAHCLAGQPYCEGGSMLVAGCGDMQPYILRQVESFANRLYCVDLSTASVRKAQRRMALWQISRLKDPYANTIFSASSIEKFLLSNKDLMFDHIEAYGVLHHLANPKDSVALLASRLKEGGTMRVMVYNHFAREWIRRIRRIFQLLQYSPFAKADLKAARRLLAQAERFYPRLKMRLDQMGPSLLSHDARFVDAFFHQREVNFTYEDWDAVWRQNGLTPLGLLDRYSELDHLENPLWKIPKVEEIAEASREGLFFNNFEIYLQKGRLEPSQLMGGNGRLLHPVTPPPLLWFSYPETEGIGLWQRWHFWQCFQRGINGQPWFAGDLQSLGKMPMEQLRRLARLGAILPSFVQGSALYNQLVLPLGGKIESDHVEDEQREGGAERFLNFLQSELRRRNLSRHERRQRLIGLHLKAI